MVKSPGVRAIDNVLDRVFHYLNLEEKKENGKVPIYILLQAAEPRRNEKCFFASFFLPRSKPFALKASSPPSHVRCILNKAVL